MARTVNCPGNINYPNALVEGLTLRNAYNGDGYYQVGSVCIDSLGGTLRACRVTGNSAKTLFRNGGGLAVRNGRAERCLLDGNNAKSLNSGLGGGLYLNGGVVDSCLIFSNNAFIGVL